MKIKVLRNKLRNSSPSDGGGQGNGSPMGGGGSNPMDGGANPFTPKQQFNQNYQNQPNSPQPNQHSQQQPSENPNHQQRTNGGEPQSNPSGWPNNNQPPTPRPSEQGIIPSDKSNDSGAPSLDKYMKPKDNSPKVEKDRGVDPYSFTNKEYGELMKGQNFTGEISPDIMTAIQQGDGSALATLINEAVANGGSMSAHLATQIAQRGTAYNMDNFRDSTLPDALNNHSFEQDWKNSDNDILKHPSVEPMVEQQRENFRRQYPDASPKQITEATRKYFDDFASAFSDSGNQKKQASQPKTNTMGDFFRS